jgi:GWxTD domain-containing protein
LHRAGFSRPITLLFLLLAAFPAPALALPSRAIRAEYLEAAARRHIALNTLEGRRFAIQELEEATQLDPNHPDWDLLLARVYFQCGFYGLSRHRFDKVADYAPNDADARFGLGLVWRQDWLKYLEPSSLERSIESFSFSARLNPHRSDAWIMLVPLLTEKSDPKAAWIAARHAREADPNRPDAMLAEAYTSYRLGEVEHADSLFAAAVPRMPRAIRARFEDIAPVASERDTVRLSKLWPKERPAFIKKFWKDLDPDFATTENEAQLEYWARVTHAYLLYYDARRQIWDERGEIYARYGPPSHQSYNDVTDTLSFGQFTKYPMNVLAWDYPDLGMHVRLQDRLLNGFYVPYTHDGILESQIVEAVPDPDSLARRSDLMSVGGDRGVFPKLPPGTRPMPVEGALARFEGMLGPRLLADFEAPGGPADSLVATWVVRDSNQVEIARMSRTLVPSACLPTEAQVADFDGEFPPGRYEVGISVRGSGGRRGVYRDSISLRAIPSRLSLSDIVVTCGVPDAATFDPREPAVRLEPNPYAIVTTGEPFTGYFEIYHLIPDATGLTHFEYEYTVRSLDRDERIWIQRLLAPRPQTQPISATREAQQIGELRRQFVSIPLESMPVGHYELSIRVRDLVAATESKTTTDFYYEPPVPPSASSGLNPGLENGTGERR